MTIRARVGSWIQRVAPGFEEFVYNRDRSRAVPGSFVSWTDATRPKFVTREPHIVVVPLDGPSTLEWGPANGNYFYEVYQTAVERFGSSAVSVFDANSPASGSWGAGLRDHLLQTKATHLIGHLERDPGDQDEWTWDKVWSQIAGQWDGVFIGVTFDSGFPLIRMKARRLARISPAFVCLDICVPMDGRLVKGRPEVGPVPLVQSQQTQDLLLGRVASTEKTTDVSFIGALYPYRVELIDALRQAGADVVVNPHRQDSTTDLVSSRKDQPGWLDYMAGLAGSRMTLNFSLASSGEDEQLKWRVMEATLAGTLLLTDDHVRTSEFFTPGEEFDRFSGPEDLPAVVARWLEQPEKLAIAQKQAQRRARALAQNEFWERISRTLSSRGLPQLPATVKSGA